MGLAVNAESIAIMSQSGEGLCTFVQSYSSMLCAKAKSMPS